jgi:hypothetical protein
MGSYRFGEVVYILYPFSDHSGAKDRPAVIISCPRYNREKFKAKLREMLSEVISSDF